MKELDYDLTFPTTRRFLERFHFLSEGTEKDLMLACYLCELCLIEVKMNQFKPSRIASSALYLSKKMLKQDRPWPLHLQQVTNLSERAVRDSAREICLLINLAHTKKVFEPIFKKYSTNKFLRVA